LSEFPYKQITSEQLDYLNIPWVMLDKLDNYIANPPNKTFILNLDFTGKPGTHWTVVRLEPEQQTILFYDPLGNKNDNKYGHGDRYEEITSIPIQLAKAAQAHGYNTVYTNEYHNQYVTSWMCGYYAIYVYMLLNKIPQITPDQFENLLISEFGRKPSRKHTFRIYKWFKSLQVPE
jgi:hypothetical protein